MADSQPANNARLELGSVSSSSTKPEPGCSSHGSGVGLGVDGVDTDGKKDGIQDGGIPQEKHSESQDNSSTIINHRNITDSAAGNSTSTGEKPWSSMPSQTPICPATVLHKKFFRLIAPSYMAAKELREAPMREAEAERLREMDWHDMIARLPPTPAQVAEREAREVAREERYERAYEALRFQKEAKMAEKESKKLARRG